MRHYEIVLLIHPDQSEQVPAMLGRYKDMVTAEKGQVHRVEDWGRRRLAYMIKEAHKAHYVMFNVECSLDMLRELEKNFKFNDSILRSFVIRREQAITEQSALAKAKAEEDRIEAEKEKQATREKPALDEQAKKVAEVAEVVKGAEVTEATEATEVTEATEATEAAKAGDDHQSTVADKAVGESADESVGESADESVGKSVDDAVGESVGESAGESAEQDAGEKESEEEKPAPQPETV